MSQCNFANAIIDHIRGYGVKLSREDWAGMRLWLQKSAEELEAWSREQERGTCADEVLKVDPTNGALRVIAGRLRRYREPTSAERVMGEGVHLSTDGVCHVCRHVGCVCP